jgi:flagella basal body P-ring formation protein FlgA
MLIALLRRCLRSLIVTFIVSIPAAVACAEDGSRLLPVPNVTIYPGDTIRENWLVDRDFSSNPVAIRNGFIESRDALVGKIARRTLLPGVPISATAVTEPRLIVNGARVRIVFVEGGMTITTYGSALQAGGAGDIVSVRNLDSGLTISGVVQPDGSVSVSGG